MRQSDKLKFDPDGSTSKHDEIVLWLYNKLNDPEFLKKYIFKNYKYLNPVIVFKKIEFPIHGTDRRGLSTGVKGFVDLAIKFDYEAEPYIEKGVSHKIKGEDHFFFEIKTNVHVGETLRQIGFYTSSTRNWFVVAPGNKYKDIFEEQGVNYIQYDQDLPSPQ